MKFSVIIANYASWAFTLRCIKSLRATGYKDFEVILVDNDTAPVPKLPKWVDLLRMGENAGFARAQNRGIGASTGDLIVILNPDTTVEKEFFSKVRTFFDDHTEAGVMGPRLLDFNGEIQLSARRDVTMITGLLGRTSFLTRLFPESSLVRSQFPAVTGSVPAPVDWVSGACMVIRREAFESLMGFDERFFMYFEDADLCRRIREAGWDVYHAPAIEVFHGVGGSSRSRPKAVWMLHKSAFLYHRKHGIHGPLNLYSAVVLLGLTARALVKLISGYATDASVRYRKES